MNVINERNLVIVGLISLVLLYFLRRRESYGESTTPGASPPIPEFNYFKSKIASCKGDSECVRNVMVSGFRSANTK